MKTFTKIISLIILQTAAMACAAEEKFKNPETSTVESSHDRVRIKVKCLKSFSKNRDVDINFSIFNGSESSYKLIHANGIIDVELDLTGPNGRRITGYHELEGSTIGRGNHKRFKIENILPGQEAIGDSVPLSLYWPLESVGEYRCIITKRIYRVDSTDTKKISSLRPGFPVDIVSPEFRFRIESIDPSYQSPAASMVSNIKIAGQTNISKSTSTKGQSSNSFPEIDGHNKSEKVSFPWPIPDRLSWYMIAGLVVLALTSLIYYFARRK